MTGKTLARVIIAVLAGVALGGTVVLAIGPRIFVPSLPPLPPPPTITAPRGELPAGIVAFEERVGGSLAGSGFLLELPNGDVVGVTTAHSLGEGHFAPLSFVAAGRGDVVATFRTLYAPLGRPQTDSNLTIDYVLMKPDTPPDPSIILRPDSRGKPQPGERVSLHSGLGDGKGGQRILHGTVERVDATGAWARMDDVFDPGLMSGSPMISQHTGRVVGSVIVMSWVPGTLRIGINPIGEIVRAAQR